MKLRFKISLAIEIILYVLIAIQLVVCVYILGQWFRWFQLRDLSAALEIITFIISVLVIILAVFLLTCRYVFRQGQLQILFGFFNISDDRTKIANITSAIVKTDSQALYISVNKEGEDAKIMQININPKYFPVFIEQLKSYNDKVECYND
ncbi:MAG: hypothetical protein PHW00_01255 [Clostridia bacterium]|nr:hypothetical protein [Clostridia bacterium]